jgi:hypothetical protein
MSAFLGALGLRHLIGVGLVAAVIGGGLPSNWYGLAGGRLGEVERLSACLHRHSAEMAALVEGIGDPHSFLHDSAGARTHALHVAERHRRLRQREANAIAACARTVSH